MLSSHRATVTDSVSKLGYSSVAVIFVDLGAMVDETYYCDLLLSQQLLPVIRHVSSEFIFHKTVPQHIGIAMFSEINTSRGNVATPLRCGESLTTFLLHISYCVYC